MNLPLTSKEKRICELLLLRDSNPNLADEIDAELFALDIAINQSISAVRSTTKLNFRQNEDGNCEVTRHIRTSSG